MRTLHWLREALLDSKYYKGASVTASFPLIQFFCHRVFIIS